MESLEISVAKHQICILEFSEEPHQPVNLDFPQRTLGNRRSPVPSNPSGTSRGLGCSATKKGMLSIAIRVCEHLRFIKRWLVALMLKLERCHCQLPKAFLQHVSQGSSRKYVNFACHDKRYCINSFQLTFF